MQAAIRIHAGNQHGQGEAANLAPAYMQVTTGILPWVTGWVGKDSQSHLGEATSGWRSLSIWRSLSYTVPAPGEAGLEQTQVPDPSPHTVDG